VNAIARLANRLSQLVLADADFVEKFLLQNFAGNWPIGTFLIFASVNDSPRFQSRKLLQDIE
jgi:hypothetical protein